MSILQSFLAAQFKAKLDKAQYFYLMLRSWLSLIFAFGLGFSLISCHQLSRTIGAGQYAEQVDHDVPLILTFHIQPKTNHDRFIGKIVRRANSAFLDHGIRIISVNIIDDIEESFISWDSSSNETGENILLLERKTLAAPHEIHIFIVDKIIDVKDGNVSTVGFYHYDGKNKCKRSIYLTLSAKSITLAHELGHFFGLDHVNDIDNIMHAPLNRRRKSAGFSQKQIKAIVKSAKKYEVKCSRRNPQK